MLKRRCSNLKLQQITKYWKYKSGFNSQQDEWTQLRQNFFSNGVVKLWNNLPEEVAMAPTVNCFKGRFDRHSADNRYSTEWKYGPAKNAQWDNHPDIIQLDNTMVNIGQQAFCLYKKKMTMWLWHIGWFACSSSTLDCLVRQCLMRHLLHVQIFV